MKIRNPLVVGLILATTLLAAPSMGASAPGQDRVVAAAPSLMTPAIKDGRVQAIAQIAPAAGSAENPTMVVGGTFTALTPKGGVETPRTKVAAFDAVTGALRAFNAVVNGEVNDVLEGPTPNTVYVAGKFTQVNGVSASHLALLDATTGALVPGFKAAATNGAVNTVVRANGRLLLGGFFTTAGGQTHQGMAAVNETTGAIDHTYMNINVTERHNNTGKGTFGSIGVKDMEGTPDGTRLIVTGNFRKVNALDRVQIVMVNLGTTAVVDSNWNTTKYAPLCYSTAFDSTMRGVSVSPDGTFFVIATTGGGARNTLCDTAARWEFSATGTDISPTWVDSSGGDTLWAVEVTEKAVYLGGHQRWMNNVDGVDYANQGAVPRAGIAALDLESGLPLAWNPGRLPRGLAVFEIYATPAGVWFGSDTDYMGNFKFKRPKLAFFPLAGGAPQPSDQVATLPGQVHLASRTVSPAVANNLATIGFDGTTVTNEITSTVDRGVPWDSVRGAFMAGDQLFYGKTDGFLYKRTFTTSTTGAEVKIDPYNDPAWAEVQTGSGGVMRGKVPSFYGQISSLTGLFYANDRIYFTRSGDSNLYWRWFNVDSGIVGAQTFTANGGRSWSDTAGLFADGSTLYIVSKATGRLQKMAFTGGVPSGAVSTVDSTRNWSAKTVFIGPRPNAAPTAAFTESCTERTCTVDGSGSTDSDGTISSYVWTYGDGTGDTGATPPAHTYAADARYPITLTVTDNQGGTHSVTKEVSVAVTPPQPSNVSFVGQSQFSASVATTSPKVTIPTGVQPGDQLILVGTYAVTSTTPSSGATAPSGDWTQIGSQSYPGSLESRVWTKVATSADTSGSTLTTTTASVKSSLTLASYRDAMPVTTLSAWSEASSTSHRSGAVTVAPEGAWLIQVWTDKSTGTKSWPRPRAHVPPGALPMRATPDPAPRCWRTPTDPCLVAPMPGTSPPLMSPPVGPSPGPWC